MRRRVRDPLTSNTCEGLGACTGDSGAPAFEMQAGRAVIIGVVSWSTGPNNTDGCGGLTGVTPLTLYREWILRTARGWGGGLGGRLLSLSAPEPTHKLAKRFVFLLRFEIVEPGLVRISRVAAC